MFNQRFVISFLLFICSYCLFSYPAASHAECIGDWVLRNPTTGSITTQESADIDCIFDWFEKNFPSYFIKSNTVTDGPLAYRFYFTSGAILGAWKTTSVKIIYLGPLSENCIMELGTVDFWKTLACGILPTPRPTPSPTLTPRPTPSPTLTPRPTPSPTLTPRPTPTPSIIKSGLWTGSNIKFNVSSDGTQITSSNSSIIYNGKTYAFALGPISTTVGTCGSIKFTLYIPAEISITDKAFSAKATDNSIAIQGNFLTSTSSSGDYSLNYYFADCAGYVKNSDTWSAKSSLSALIAEDSDNTNTYEIEENGNLIVIQRN